MDNNALKNEFLVESFENLSSINEDLTQLEKNPKDKELLNKIYRTVHTMKGSAGFLGYKNLQEVTHSAENLLDELREDNLSLSSDMTDNLLQAFDLCSTILKSIESSDVEGAVDENVSIISEKLNKHMNGSTETKSSDEDTQITENSNVLKDESDDDDDDDELGNLLDSHRNRAKTTDNTTNSKSEESSSGISSAAMDSLKELVGEGKVDSSALEELESEQSSTVNSEKQQSEDNISSAAMDSLKELIGEGKVDASALEEVQSEQKPTPTSENNKAQDNVSSAAMDSLKELVGEGKVDASAIAELEGNSAPIEEKSTVKAEPIVKEKPEAATTTSNKNDENMPSLKDAATTPIDNKSIADSFVRVNVSVLDKIMNIVGELVLNRNQIVQFANVENNHDFTKLSQHLNTITSELQSEVMSTRMQPIGSILTKFERLVRDFSRTSGKKIALKLSGQETELDKTLIEAIKDPLVHIIRNACDHGLESVEDRSDAGKNATGTILIKAYNESGQVTIEIQDDGRGLDRDKIGAKAVEKGVISSEQLNKMSDQQVYGLIFAPGFSTAEKVTNISGRGVGMDVVKTNIEKIGGSVSVNSNLGDGSTFKLKIPLTLAIVPALVIQSLDEFFAVPQLNLVELVRLESDEEKGLIEKIQGSEFLKLRGNLTPVFRLNEVLDLHSVQKRSFSLSKTLEDYQSLSEHDEDNASSVTKFNERVDDAENIIILSAEDQFFGIIADEILDTEEIVVKPLSNNLKHLNLFGGATIMGDGRVALILDALGFLNTVTDSVDRVKEEHFKENEKDLAIESAGELQENLLIKLGDQRTYAIPLQLVTRLEEFDCKKIERTGNQPVIRYLNSPMPLINVEKTLNLSGESMLKRFKKEQKEVVSCIVTTIRGRNFGIIVDEIKDISIDHSEIDNSAVDRDGILGTIFVEDKTISLLDIYSIIDAQGLGSKKEVKKEELIKKKSKRILLVDDSAMYRKMEADALIEQGYQVDVANNGEHGYEILENNNYDLLITDIEMPILDGFDFAKKVRSNSNKKDITIVALSTRSSDKDKQKGLESGFNYHLEKFRKDEVIDLVDKLLAGE